MEPLGLTTLRRPASWTLRSKLVASMLALFVVVTLASGAATVFALRGYLYDQIDGQLRSSVQRYTGGNQGPTPNSNDRGRGPGNEGLYAVFGTVNQGVAADSNNQRVALTEAQLAQISAAGIGSTPVNIDLGGTLGQYRVISAQGLFGTSDGLTQLTVVSGLPTGPEDRTVGRMIVIGLSGVLGGLVLVGLAGTWLVRRNLRPLHRVAATATRVAHLPLAAGQVDIAERVPAEDTDTRTEVGQVGAALNEMLDHIDGALNARQKSEERVRQFVADASHELRTPLASIRGYAELTRREREPVPPTVVHAIGRVESEAMRMSTLVEDLLLLARLDAGRPLDHVTVDLTEMVVNAVSDAHAASPDHVWQLDLPDEPVEVQGDPARLHQIVANLLGNARTHTAPGTVVRTSISPEPGRVRISVRDNGPGVPEDLQPNVFQRFARGDSSRNRAAGSTGLGLSIVAAVAQAHGGTVELDSQPGDTTFSVLLPA
ncbi:MAG: HAMP domain-containing histidine kinase [Actinomycetota bacterium]|nr:HAMP domain-containing histidine kinase [Actinomycetota bacterium]